VSVLAAALAAALLTAPVDIVSISVEQVEGRQALRVATSERLAEVSVSREEGELVVYLEAGAPEGLLLPEVSAPIDGIRIEKKPRGVALHVRLSAQTPYEVRRETKLLTIFFGERVGETHAAPPSSGELAELYKTIFPATGPQAGGVPSVSETQASKPTAESDEGISLGPVSIHPSMAATYVDAESSLLGTPQPVRDRYYELDPRVRFALPISAGHLNASYETHLHRGSAFAIVNDTSHLADADLEIGLGGRLTVRASDHFVVGALETTEVDPGREYFFRLSRFHRNAVALGARLELGSHFDLDVNASHNRVTFAPGSGFFGYDQRSAAASLGYEFGTGLRGSLVYSYDQIPPPAERPQDESQAHFVGLSLAGEIVPLLNGTVSVGYSDRSSPRAGPGGTSHQGLEGAMSLTKQFTRGASLALSGGRSTLLSAFEGNAFYIYTRGGADLTFSLPFSVAVRVGATYQVNGYQTADPGLGAPREDHIFGWTAGLGRAIRQWAYLRADYRHDRRTSNLQVFDVSNHALTVQVGVGLFGKVEQ
jgi:hypothetical protein